MEIEATEYLNEYEQYVKMNETSLTSAITATQNETEHAGDVLRSNLQPLLCDETTDVSPEYEYPLNF